MTKLENYLNDGANWQAQAVLSYLRSNYELLTYNRIGVHEIRVEVGRYENCREQGYVFRLYVDDLSVKNYCVFEHRNSDNICVIEFESDTFDTPSVETIWKDKENKWDIDKTFEYGQIVECGDYIQNDILKTTNDFIVKQDNILLN